MINLLSDIKEAVKLTREIRQTRKNGGEKVTVQAVKQLPHCGAVGLGFLDTMEGGALWNKNKTVYRAVAKIYDAFPVDAKAQLSFHPKSGGYCNRVRFWQTALKLALPSNQYYIAMSTIYGWYRHIKSIDKEKAPQAAATAQSATQENKVHNHSTADQAICQVSRWGEL